MSTPLKERNEIEEQYRWDLSTLYASDEAFEEDFRKLDACIANVAAFAGKLTDAASIKAWPTCAVPRTPARRTPRRSTCASTASTSRP